MIKMEKILLTLHKQAESTGNMKAATIQRAIAYNNAHPMWAVMARPEAVAAYEAVTAQA